jgi:hypothetical protein
VTAQPRDSETCPDAFFMAERSPCTAITNLGRFNSFAQLIAGILQNPELEAAFTG